MPPRPQPPSATHLAGALLALVCGAACGADEPGAPSEQAAGAAEAVATRTQGPMIGGVRPDRATIWFGLSASATVTVTLTPAPSAPLPSRAVDARTDFTGKLELSGLRPRTRYTYRLRLDGRPDSAEYSFVTTPGDATQPTVSFAVLSDFRKGECPSLLAASALQPAMVLFLGDLDHRGPGKGTPDAWVDDMRLMRRELRDSRTTALGRAFSSTFVERGTATQPPLYYVWDDHDYCDNNADSTCAAREAAFQVYDEYFVRAPGNPGRGPWQRLRYGRTVDVFLLDARASRTPVTMPDGPDKSMLGAEQLAWLQRNLRDSRARWKIIASPVPFHAGTKTYDAWGAYPTERAALVDFIRAQAIEGVVVISGDIHTGGAVELGDHSELLEVTVPHANMGRDLIDTYKGEPGTWSLGTVTSSAPITGLDHPGFVWVEASPTQLVVSVRDSAGQLRATADTHTPLELHLPLTP